MGTCWVSSGQMLMKDSFALWLNSMTRSTIALLSQIISLSLPLKSTLTGSIYRYLTKYLSVASKKLQNTQPLLQPFILKLLKCKPIWPLRGNFLAYLPTSFTKKPPFLTKWGLPMPLTLSSPCSSMASYFSLTSTTLSTSTPSISFYQKNPVPTLLADTYHSIHELTLAGRGTILCCAPLLYRWIISHLPRSPRFTTNPENLL